MGKEPYMVTGHNGATEKGYNALMRQNILGTERSIRRRRDEELHVFDSKGNPVKAIQGKGAEVKFNGKLPENSILTHNHPRALGKSGIKAIGNSFSGKDVVLAVSSNAKEMRAVTPTYTFSIKRPKGGWGATPREVERAYRQIENQLTNEVRSGYLTGKRAYADSSYDRATVTHYHKVMKRLAKRFGWSYTKRNS